MREFGLVVTGSDGGPTVLPNMLQGSGNQRDSLGTLGSRARVVLQDKAKEQETVRKISYLRSLKIDVVPCLDLTARYANRPGATCQFNRRRQCLADDRA